MFRRLYGGHVLSVAGDALYLVAAVWLVFELTGSTAYTGLAGALIRAPRIFRAFTGPLVDRWPLRTVLIASELLQGLVVIAVPLAELLGVLNVGIVLAVLPIVAFVGQFAGPAQSASLPRVVEREDMVSANTLIQVSTQTVRMAARVVAGTIISILGAVSVYVLDVVTFAVCAIVFASVTIPGDSDATRSLPTLDEYRTQLEEGVTILKNSPLGPAVLAVGMVTLITSSAMAVLPAFASKIGGPRTYGLLLGALSAGTLLGSIIARRIESRPFGKVVVFSFLSATIAWTAAILIPAIPLTVVFLGAAFIPIGLYNVLASTALQVGVPDEMVGRVSAVSGSLGGIAAPIGLLAGGLLGELFSVSRVLLASGAGFALTAVAWVLIPSLRSFPAIDTLDPGTFT